MHTTDAQSEQGRAIVLPADLERRLAAFRGMVRRIKLFEACCGAICGIAIAFLVLFLCDRLFDTPRWARFAVAGGAVAACAAIPLAVHRWVWRHRSLDQVARLIGRRFPSMGDELLGIIEIVRGAAAGGQSRALCEAAVAQVAERSRACDFRQAMPPARPWLWATLAALPVAGVVAVAAVASDAAGNSWARLLAPWKVIDRFTFARIAPLPERLVVPHGEPATLGVSLGDDTRWRPALATARIDGQPPLTASRDDHGYAFTLPPQLVDGTLALAVGDVRRRLRIEPKHRPVPVTLDAEVTLPDYLERKGVKRQDIRGGTLAPLKGSSVSVVVTASRDLAAATVDGVEVEPEATVIRTPPRLVAADSRMTVTWRDREGLAGAEPLELVITSRTDEPPTVVMLDVPQTRGILLNTDTLKFQVAARDDFGIRKVGLAWEGLADPGVATDAASIEKGDRILRAGGGEVESLDAAATFCPEALGIAPQAIALRAFAEDFLPGRARVYSSPLLLYVLDRGEHALVLNTRLQQFRQQASEVRDREMGLLAVNKELRGLPAEQLASSETRARLEAQASAEQANARRLERLVDEGGDLVREALKNPEFEAGTLEQLAEDIQTLADIADQRMPSVAELLEQAATARLATGKPGAGQEGQEGRQPKPGDLAGKPAAGKPDDGEPGDSGEQPPKVGEERNPSGGGGSATGGEQPPQPPVPQVVDVESSQQPKGDEPKDGKPASGGAGRLGLPTTQAGVSPPSKPPAPDDEPAADEALDDAIAAQEQLLAEFAKVADDLAAVMARLEGSTFVKRLKLASREQGSIGSRIAGMAAEAFGKADRQPAQVRQALGDVREQTVRETDKMSALMDDLQAYFDRRQLPAFRTVLEEMKDLDTLGSLRQLSDDVTKEAGMSIAQAEFWSDTFDRLADDLVPPPQDGSGQGEGSQSQESVPPEVVLEAMKILEDEVNLREETRVAQQGRGALGPEEIAGQAKGLAERQEALADRVFRLTGRLLEEPDGERSFQQEIQLFEKVETVMAEASGILGTGDTGPKAIGAETEAIELLLAAQAACSNCSKGGGGGAGGRRSGGGSTGTASDSALALVGRGNRGQRAEGGGEQEQATGTSGRVLPEEFRAGLDAYFNRFEKERR
ncbi:MAG: hypothetical protein K8S94_13880 [Planctomycetia bacterium]|nr:hypothetical protein [Planctomycetia bacterium]